MTVSMDKKYRTRDGREVRIYAVDGGGDQPVHGAARDESGWVPETWSAGGSFCEDSSYEAPWDLIEVKPERGGWINIYPLTVGSTIHPTKEAADKHNIGRIACIHVKFTEGEGLNQ